MKRTALKRTSRLRGPSSKRRASGAEYVAFVLGVKARDQFRCRYCRTQRGPLDPHHVVKRSRAPHLLMDAANVVTLCRACHDWTDAAYSAPEGRLVVDRLGDGQFAFSVVHGANKWSVRAAGQSAPPLCLPPLSTS